MNFLNKMERKYGRYALRNLPEIMIGCYALGYVLQLFFPEILGYLTLEPVYILRGQIWRLVTWVVVPPYSFDLFTIITLFFLFFHCQDAGEHLGSVPVQCLYLFGDSIYGPGSVSSLWRSGRWIPVRLLFLQHILYQYVDIPGLCCDLSRYAGAFVFPVSHKDEMDGTDLRGIYSGRIYTGILD